MLMVDLKPVRSYMNSPRKKMRCFGAVWPRSIGRRFFHAAGAKYVIPREDLTDMSTQIKYHVSRRSKCSLLFALALQKGEQAEGERHGLVCCSVMCLPPCSSTVEIERCIPLKRRVFSEPHGVTAQITSTTVRAPNLTWTAMFGTTREETTGEWRKLHSEELHNLHS
jgi:hypothetical protein